MNVVGKAAKMYQYRKSCRQDTNLTCQIEYNVSIKKMLEDTRKSISGIFFGVLIPGEKERRFRKKKNQKAEKFSIDTLTPAL